MAEKHVHKLMKRKYKNSSAFFCILPDCFFKLVDSNLALGKRTICHQCGEEFELNEYSVKLKRPHCSNCGKVKVVIDGETRYVRRNSGSDIISQLGRESTSDLRKRLDTASNVIEDDI